MPQQDRPAKRRAALRRGATESGIAAELLMLLETITADGTITDAETRELQGWLQANRNSDLPAIDFLRTTLEQILADGRITDEERKALYKAVERTLPADLREKAKGRRVASELVEKAQEREARAAQRTEKAAERERNRPVYSANFLVAGVAYEARAKVVDQHLEPGHAVFLVREPLNPHDPNAIEIRLREGYQIGYVPREDAREMAPLLDSGCKQRAYCTKILDGSRAPIPVIQAYLYRPDATVQDAVTSEDIPTRKGVPVPSDIGCCLAVRVALLVALAVVFILSLRSR